MENKKQSSIDWFPFFYNGCETNIEATQCGRIRKIKRDWYGNGKGAYRVKIGEIYFNNLKLHHQGYKRIKVQIKNNSPKTLLVHQIVASTFLEYTFQGHKFVIDHIDSNKENNHVSNLRIITPRENCSKEKTIKKGLPVGVHWKKQYNKYFSRIWIDGKEIFLGYFNTKEEASLAYQLKLKNNQTFNK